ncbi:axoneme-associated protein mst101(2)-like [Lytechinus pictus]|uniref:axoneme-associated protein mst101(2)-like n=1 Tax=Lytechinus pictus TaxID=7653 RepID=UPI0030B9F9F8
MASQEDPTGPCQLSVRKRPLTSAEKQKKYRERLKQSPERYELFKQCEAMRRRDRSRTHQPTEEELALKRMKSRERVRKHRLKKKLEALTKEEIFEEQVCMSMDSLRGLIPPEAFDVDEEVATATNLNHSNSSIPDYLPSNMEPFPEMNVPELNIGEYIVHARGESNMEESAPSTVKLEYDMNLEDSLDDSALVTCEDAVVKSEMQDNGNVDYIEESPSQMLAGRTVLSVVEAAQVVACEKISKQRKRNKKPLTAAERQRNYIARLKAHPEKWEEHKKKCNLRRKIIQQQKTRKEFESQRKTKKNQRKRTQKSKEYQTKGTDDACEVSAATEDIQSKVHSHLNMNLSELKVEQSDRDACPTSSQSNHVNGLRVGHSSAPVKGMQNHPSITFPMAELAAGSHEQTPKRRPLTPAERQQNYRARKKAKARESEELKAKEREKRKMMLIEAEKKRRRAAERQREYRRRKKALSLAKNIEAITTNTNFNQVEISTQNVDISGTNTEIHDEWTREVESEVGQSSFYGDGSPTIVEKMQNQWLAWPLVSSSFARRDLIGQVGQPARKKPMTAAERQRQYRQRLKAKPERWKQYKARESERRKRTQEAAGLEQRKKTVDEQRDDPDPSEEMRSRLNELGDPMGGYLLSTDPHHELRLGHMGDCLVHVKEEGDCSQAKHDINPAYENGRECLQPPPLLDRCQNELPVSPSDPSSIKGRPRRRRRKKAMTPAERQRQYRARLKANKDKEFEGKKGMEEIQIPSGEAAQEQRREAETGQMGDLCLKGDESNRMDKLGETREKHLIKTEPHFDVKCEFNSDQYPMNKLEASNNLGNLECSVPDGVDQVTSHVKHEEQYCSPAKPDVDPANEEGIVQSASSDSKNQSEPLQNPSLPLIIKGYSRRRSKRRKAMTGAERQRQYRERKRAKLGKEDQEKLKVTETPKSIQDFKVVSENSASAVHQQVTKRMQQLSSKREEVELDQSDKKVDTIQPLVARQQLNRRVKGKPKPEIAMESVKRVNRTRSTVGRRKQQAEAQLAFKRMKGRERMRKYRLKQKQKLQRVVGEPGECSMPKIVAVWSMNQGTDQGVQENINQSFNVPETGSRIVDDFAKLIPEDYIMPVNRIDSSHFDGYPSGSSTSCKDIFPKLPIPKLNPNRRCEEAFERRSRRLTSAERQRRYRKRLQQDPEKWAAYKRKEYERYVAKKAMAVNEMNETTKQNHLNMRKCTSNFKQRKSLQDNASDNALGKVGSGYCRGKRQASLIPGKSAVLTEGRSVGRCAKSRHTKSPEEIERIRKANRERQRLYRARKTMRQSMQRTSIFADRTGLPVPADLIATDEMEKSQILRKAEQCSGHGMSQDIAGSESYRSAQYSMCNNLSSLSRIGPRNCGRPRLPRQIMNQPPGRPNRGRPQRQVSLETDYGPDVALDNRLASSLESEGDGEVLVSSAGNLPMVIKMPSVNGQRYPGLEEIPEVIPCDPPEAVFDWGNIDLDHFHTTPEEEVPLDNIEVREPAAGEGECVYGSARRKAFFPTKHDSADLTPNAALVSETLIEDP